MNKVGHGIVALSSAAIIAVYAAGHARTRSAAEALDAASPQRRPVIPGPAAADASAIAAPAAERRAPSPPADATPLPGPQAAANVAPQAARQPAVKADAAASTANLAGTVPTPKPAAAGPKAQAPAATSTPSTAASESPASAPAAASVPPAAAAPAKKFKDGTYRAWGRSRHGDMLAFVVIENGRIVHSGVDRCETRWPCSLVAHLYPQVLQRQSAEVDYVTGATDSANAFYYGIVEALNMAEAPAAEAPTSLPTAPVSNVQ